MKNVSNPFIEVLFTLIVAGLLSGILLVVLAFIAANLNLGHEGQYFACSVSSVVFGLVVGYKLGFLAKTKKK